MVKLTPKLVAVSGVVVLALFIWLESGTGTDAEKSKKVPKHLVGIQQFTAEIEERDQWMMASLDAIQIEDKNFYQCIKTELSRYLGIHPSSSGADFSVHSIRSLYCPNMDIKRLDGAQSLTSLQFFDVSRNPIRRIHPLYTLENLTNLDLSNVVLRNPTEVFLLPHLKSVRLPDFTRVDCEHLDKWKRKNKVQASLSRGRCRRD